MSCLDLWQTPLFSKKTMATKKTEWMSPCFDDDKTGTVT